MSTDSDGAQADALVALFQLYGRWSEATRRDSATWPRGWRCPSGCSVCCERSGAIPVSPVETLAAALICGDLDEPLRRLIRRRVASVAARLTGLIDVDAPGPVACPLLVNGRCSVYGARPLACRAYGFAAQKGNVYFGCEILEKDLAGQKTSLPDFDAASAEIPRLDVLDRDGRALPEVGPLAEMLDRLMPEMEEVSR